jgi:thioredoxin reductase (NADPH)
MPGILALPNPEVMDSWLLKRPPLPFETTIPGIFAVGDVQASSVKRVAAAAGEEPMAVQFVYRGLAMQ